MRKCKEPRNKRGSENGFQKERERILKRLGRSWRALQEPGRWLQDENLSGGIGGLDRVEKERMGAIDRSVRELETGS